MAENLQAALNAAILRLLRPLVRLLLNHGMAYGSFAELARKAYVEEGFEHVARSGKRASVSTVSALTGLTRKETKRLREAPEAGEADSTARYSRAIRVISGWVNEPRFHDGAGEPAVLPFEGDARSFSTLVKEFSGDIPPAAMLSVLQASQNVALVDGQVQLLERAYLPMATPIDKINILGTDVAELIATIGHNLEVGPEQRFFQRKVSNTSVSAKALGEFMQLSNRKSQQLLEEYHSWLSAHQVDTVRETERETDGETDREIADESRYVAVGIYFIEHPDKEVPL